jgi:hypothetical protein
MKNFNAYFFPAGQGLTTPIVLQATAVDSFVTVVPGWYALTVQGNDVLLQMNGTTDPNLSPCYSVGHFPFPVWLGYPATQGGIAPPPLALHAATLNGAATVTLTPLKASSSP